MNQREINVLANMLARLEPRKAKAGKKNQPAATPGTSGAAIVVGGKKNRRQKRGKGGIDGSGAVKISRRELLYTVTTTQATGLSAAVSLKPSASAMPWLYGLSKSFEQIAWHKLVIQWVPMVATTTPGSIAIGLDWTGKCTASDATRAKTVCLTPVMDTPLWQRATLVVPASRLQSRKYYTVDSDDAYDTSPGTLCVNVTGTNVTATLGEVWVDYSISLLGTRSNA